MPKILSSSPQSVAKFSKVEIWGFTKEEVVGMIVKTIGVDIPTKSSVKIVTEVDGSMAVHIEYPWEDPKDNPPEPAPTPPVKPLDGPNPNRAWKVQAPLVSEGKVKEG